MLSTLALLHEANLNIRLLTIHPEYDRISQVSQRIKHLLFLHIAEYKI